MPGLVLVFGVAGLGLAYLPWKTQVAHRLQAVLKEKGFQNVQLTLSDMGMHGATFDNVTLGNETFPLSLKNIVVHYSPFELWHGNLQGLTISGVSLEVKKVEGKWVVQGLDNGSATPSTSLKIPVNSAEIPVDQLIVEDSNLNILGENWNLNAPVALKWQKNPDSEISLQSENIKFNAGNFSVNAGKGEAKAKLGVQETGWAGSWHLKGIKISGGPAEWPVMEAAGTLSAGANTIAIEGGVKSPDNLYGGTFRLDYASSGPTALTLVQANMPWHGGTLAVQNVTIPLAEEKPANLVLQVQAVSIGQLMEAMTGKRVSATGMVSGDLPLIIGHDGSITLGDGILQAAGPGIISMPPDLIPGDNEQVAMTREILKNFHYNGLSVAVSGNQENGLSLLVALEGNNPDVYEGRPVKLNVRLVGDVLDFMRQNVMFVMDPKTLLKQDKK